MATGESKFPRHPLCPASLSPSVFLRKHNVKSPGLELLWADTGSGGEGMCRRCRRCPGQSRGYRILGFE